jgi:alkanesulfonate monooxygenase SsuD/methylene tetrahydromethanopterin reductase-like flavin-dependent oxidoreductase (luciferase family)
MCDGAGIEALWVRDHLAAPDREARLEAWTALTLASRAVSRARMGAVLDPALRPPGTVAAMVGTLDAALGGRLELALSAGGSGLEDYARILRELLTGQRLPVDDANAAEAEIGMVSPQVGGPPLSIEAITPGQMEAAARLGDDVLIQTTAAKDIRAAAEQVRTACDRVGRDPGTLGIALEVPVSIGRTSSEAEARARGDSLFREFGWPQEVGIFGTLEQCQERVIELAHAGVSDLRCIVPNNPDVHDVIAQLTAITVGTVDVLTPNTPKSRAPDPPTGWGGRSSVRS